MRLCTPIAIMAKPMKTDLTGANALHGDHGATEQTTDQATGLSRRITHLRFRFVNDGMTVPSLCLFFVLCVFCYLFGKNYMFYCCMNTQWSFLYHFGSFLGDIFVLIIVIPGALSQVDAFVSFILLFSWLLRITSSSFYILAQVFLGGGMSSFLISPAIFLSKRCWPSLSYCMFSLHIVCFR